MSTLRPAASRDDSTPNHAQPEPEQAGSRSSAERLRRRRRLPPPGRAVHRCMVLAVGPEDTTAVDLRTQAFVRLRTEGAAPVSLPGTATMSGPAPPTENGGFLPFDVVDATWADDPQRDDLAQPEAVTTDGAPALVGSWRDRHVRRLFKALVAPPSSRLLGFAGSAVPYWELHGMQPSVALVEPSSGPVLLRRTDDDSVWCRFGWPGSDNWLEVEDRRALAALRWAGRDRLSGRSLAAELGFRPQYLLVTLSRPRQGHCYKKVAAVLPRP